MPQAFNCVTFWVVLAWGISINVAVYFMARSFSKELREYRKTRDRETLIKIDKIMKMVEEKK